MATKNKAVQAAPTKVTITTPEEKARAALLPSINGAVLIAAYQSNIMGNDASIGAMIDGLRDTFKEVKNGDLHTMEGMLISQATALQTIFTHLAKRAVSQEQMKHFVAFLGLALKAQAQSRATISALVDLKYPRQATFVKQANIAHGPQQVNNGTAGQLQGEKVQALTHGENPALKQNKLLEVDHGQPSGRMDTRAAQTSERSNQAVETVEGVNRAKKPRG